jgi:putative transcriptional regulator
MGRGYARTSRGRSELAFVSEQGIGVHLDDILERRQMTLTELAQRIDITIVNLSVLKNGRAKAVRFSTLAALCEALDCQPGDLLTYED